ncbi:T9SS type B sorting domain-containing protein [Flavobacterium muglaense]|uniref:T9SS type B sorting domain-containing protein n=1 Tax=Flavobacterium muglaense TaxID=2764716 RepID=A0A923N0Q2_9FLAO|nr:T9SS type B sorting domain-containing protein [Flavobacterium muglaense]MBC5838543.1 T9SS type B sorting domain-containing protein [Flavobacterium muglaense]MBC5845077.1 T9SS type B sorting domain-containing protein [Flavobacterium muglaense]
MKQRLLFVVVITLFLTSHLRAQLCTGSLGDAVVNIDFGSGTGRGGALGSAITAYTYSASGKLDEGYYTIVNTTTGLRDNAWHIITDHTGNTNGYMMVVNASTLATAGIFYTKTVTNLCPGTTYEFSAWLMNVMTFTSPNPNVTFTVSTTSGTVLGTYNTGSLAVTSSGTWKQAGFYFTTGTESEVVITMLNNAVGAAPGNDLALDDITFRACGPIVSAMVQNNSSTSLSICDNDAATYTLTGNLGTSVYSDPAYQWQVSQDNGTTWTDVTGATSLIYNAVSNSAGSYLYRMTTAQRTNIASASCRVSSNNLAITVAASPLRPSVTTVQPSCALPSGKITVDSPANCTYSINGSTYQSNAVFSGLAGGDYSVTAKSATGCVSAAQLVHIDTVVPNAGTVTFMAIQPVICVDPLGTITFTNVDAEYSFDNGATWSTVNAKTGLVADTYNLKSRNSYACETPAVAVEIFVPPGYPPTPSVVVTQPDCFMATGTITVSDSAPLYSYDNGTTWVASNSINGLSAGTYAVLIKNALGCVSLVANSVKIIGFINTEPLPVATSPQQFCVQQNASLNDLAITGTAIKWYDAAANGNLLAGSTVVQTGTYYASQSVTSCESLRIPVVIAVQNTPAPTAVALQDFCTTQKPTIANLIVTGTNVIWYDASANGIVLPVTTALLNGLTYYASQTVNGCESVNRVAVAVSIVAPAVPLNDVNDILCDALSDGKELVDLSTYNSQITPCASCVLSYYSSLSGAENQDLSAQITLYSTYNVPLGNTDVFVRIDSNDKCYQVAKLSLSVVSNPVIAIKDNVVLCESSSVTVDAGSGFDSYLWSTGETSSSIVIQTVGSYSVTISQGHGSTTCSSTKNFKVFASNVATIAKVEIQDWTDTDNVIVVTVADPSQGDYKYSIDGINYQDSNTFTGLLSGDYIVYVKDNNECGIVNQEVFILNYPKYFTPNADGYNDTWAIKFSETEPTIDIKIFDRYGKFIKQLNATSSWDGTFNGHQLPATDYWFVVTRASGKVFKGHFSMKR